MIPRTCLVIFSLGLGNQKVIDLPPHLKGEFMELRRLCDKHFRRSLAATATIRG
jgi:hypothetical protein